MHHSGCSWGLQLVRSSEILLFAIESTMSRKNAVRVSRCDRRHADFAATFVAIGSAYHQTGMRISLLSASQQTHCEPTHIGPIRISRNPLTSLSDPSRLPAHATHQVILRSERSLRNTTSSSFNGSFAVHRTEPVFRGWLRDSATLPR